MAERIPKDEYEKTDGFRQSDLKAFRSDPELFRARQIGKYPRPSGPHFEFGCTVEAFLRGDLQRNVVIIPPNVLTSNGHRRGRAWDSWRSQQDPEATLLTALEYESQQAYLDDIQKNVRDCHLADVLLTSPGEWNVCIQWEFAPLGCTMKTEIDRVCTAHEILVDVKTADDVSRLGFAKSAEDYGYWIQAYCQQQAWAQLRGGEVWDHCFVCVRNKPAYSVRCRPLPNDWIAAAEEWLIDTIQHYWECERTGLWREQDWDQPIELDRPRWARK